MLALRLTTAQAEFLDVEIIGRHIDDDDEGNRSVCWVMLDSFIESKGTRVNVDDRGALQVMILEAINGIDDEIENHKRGDARALARIGGVDTVQEAMALHRAGTAILAKIR